jgi:hypothetical protein
MSNPRRRMPSQHYYFSIQKAIVRLGTGVRQLFALRGKRYKMGENDKEEEVLTCNAILIPGGKN